MSDDPEVVQRDVPDVSGGAARVITAAQARAVDRYAAEVLGLPEAVLMENAAINAAGVCLDMLADVAELDRDRFLVAILCGGGSNGGDGYAMARHLLAFGVDVELYAHRPVDGLKGASAMNARAAAGMGIPLYDLPDGEAAGRCRAKWAGAHVIVEALVGTGATPPLRPALAGIVRAVNALRAEDAPGRRRPRVLALDVPAGVDADTGAAGEDALRADVTVTFAAAKAGLRAKAAREFVGRCVVADIGLPDAAVGAALRWAAAR